jgi:transposase
MTIKDFKAEELMQSARQQIADEPNLSPALKNTLDLLLALLGLLLLKFSPKNSRNSGLPPSLDPNRPKNSKAKNKRKPGAQPGRPGTTLKAVDEPDRIEVIEFDHSQLPPGKWRDSGRYLSRQVFDITVNSFVTEYRAPIMVNESGQEFHPAFPEGVVSRTQYGPTVKAMSVYMSQFQLLPCERIADMFADQMNLPLSAGSVVNFNREAFEALESFEKWVSDRLAEADVLNLDETSINIGGKRVWLHLAANDLYTRYFPHLKRGSEAINEMGIVARSAAILCHDHWKPYFLYGNEHALCNAHILRELAAVYETDKSQSWAFKCASLLKHLNRMVDKAGGMLAEDAAENYKMIYRRIMELGELQNPETPRPPGKKGPMKKSPAQNLLLRLRQHEDDVLRFMSNARVPFTNNLAEQNLRMAKVQQKISGCFRTYNGAATFCRIRGFLSTCQKHSFSPSLALTLLSNGKLPPFVLLSKGSPE